MAKVERVMYDMGTKGYVVGKEVGRRMSDKGLVIDFADSAVIPKASLPKGISLDEGLAERYVQMPRDKRHYPVSEFMSPQPRRILVDLE